MINEDFIKQEILHGPFSIELHKEWFHNYLEVVILKDGTVEYATPSHQEKLIQLVMNQNNWDRDMLMSKVPREYWCDMIEWLHLQCGAIPVWSSSYVCEPNDDQRNAMMKLYHAGIMTELPHVNRMYG